MLKIKDIKNGDAVMLDDYHSPPLREMKVINVAEYVNGYTFVKCEWIEEGEIKTDTFLPGQLTLIMTYDEQKYPHLGLLKQLFDEAFAAGANYISLYYYPNAEHEVYSYCSERVTIREEVAGFGMTSHTQGFNGLGALIHYFKVWIDHGREVTGFLGEKFFTGA